MKTPGLFLLPFPRLRLGLFLLLAVGPVRGATLTVTNSNDAGAGSLRQAIADANATPVADLIVFDAAGHFAVARTITLTTGELEITSAMTILGPMDAAQRVSVSANGLSRVFFVGPGTPTSVTFRHLTIRDGEALAGGGILCKVSGTALFVEDCIVTACVATELGGGGGIAAEYGSLTMTTTSVTGNTSAGHGGGITMREETAFLANGVVSGNALDGNYDFGGGIYLNFGCTVEMLGMTLENNTTMGGGGALAMAGSVLVADTCVFSGNVAGLGDGGGISIYNDCEVTVTASTFAGNHASQTGGAIYADSPDGTSTVTVLSGCTFSGNTADDDGGALWLGKGATTLVNCTLSGNVSFGFGGGIAGGFGSDLVAVNCTLTGNEADGGGAAHAGTGSRLDFGNSILAGNDGVFEPDLSAETGESVESSGHNLVGVDPGGAGDFSNGAKGDLVGTAAAPLDPLLGPLQNNGGVTLTHAMLFGSPALEGGDSARVMDPPFDGPFITDQRGQPRIAGGAVDIGAYEFPALEVTNTNDAGVGSLRELVAQAQTLGGGVVTFRDSTFGAVRQEITLTGGQIPVTTSTTILAPPVGVRISGGNGSRIFAFSGGDSTLGRLVLVEGSSTGEGGGVRVSGAATTLLMNDVSVRLCSALEGGGLLVEAGSVTATRCDFITNTATAGGGGGIKVSAGGRLNLTNATVSDNAATTDGGGIFHAGGQTRLVNCTVNENRADSDADGTGDGGGLLRAAGSVRLGNTIMSANRDQSVSPMTKHPDLSGSFVSLGHNFLARSDGSSGIADGTLGDQAGTVAAPLDPLLTGLAGDSVFPPDPASPAVDAGDNALLEDEAWPALPRLDQRGQFRVFEGVVDLGAVEQPAGIVVKLDAPFGAASEHGPLAASCRLRRSFHDNPLVVDLTLDPTGTAAASDYTLSGPSYVSTAPTSFTVTFPAGVDSLLLTLTPTADTVVEGTETLVLSLGGTGYRRDPAETNTRTFEILDDEFTVTNSANNGEGTLRRAINEANAAGGGTITIPSALDISLGGSPLTLDGDVEIIGNVSTVSAAGQSRVFEILGDGGGLVRLQGLIITGGQSPAGEDGGGILIESGTVEIRGCAITGNRADGDGGGIFTEAGGSVLTMINASVDSNESGASGGGLLTMARNFSSLFLTNITFSRNRAALDGGGLVLRTTNSSETLTNCTITENVCDSDNNDSGNGGGLLWTAGEITLNNTVISGNFDTPKNAGAPTLNPDVFTFSGSVASGGGNFIGQKVGAGPAFPTGSPNGLGDYIGTAAAPLDAQLVRQEDLRVFYAFPPTSLLLDRGVSATVTASNDLRGRPRISGISVDIGAIEMSPHLVTNDDDNGPGSFRAAVENANLVGFGDIVFTSGAFTIDLFSGEVVVTGAIDVMGNLDDNGLRLVRLHNNDGGRLLRLAPAATTTMTFRNLNLYQGNTTGHAPGDQDGANLLVGNNANAVLRHCDLFQGTSPADGGNARVLANGSLTAYDTSFRFGNGTRGGNLASGGEITLRNCALGYGLASTRGGGLFNGGTGQLTNCTIHDNGANTDGGGIYTGTLPAQTLALLHCTVTRNSADADQDGSGVGGGIRRFSGIVTVKNSLIDANVRDQIPVAVPEDLSGVFTSLGHNLVGTGGNGFTDSVNGDMTGTPAVPLVENHAPTITDNGGPTSTLALNCLSLSRDQGDPDGAPATDQRGLPRRFGDGVDIGAYELQPESYGYWARHVFPGSALLTGPFEDYEGDGVPNGLEYLLGTRPTLPDAASEMSATSDGTTLTVTVPISPLAMPGSYRVVLSTDLVGWNLLPEASSVTGCTAQGYLTGFTRAFPGATAAYGRLEYVQP